MKTCRCASQRSNSVRAVDANIRSQCAEGGVRSAPCYGPAHTATVRQQRAEQAPASSHRVLRLAAAAPQLACGGHCQMTAMPSANGAAQGNALMANFEHTGRLACKPTTATGPACTDETGAAPLCGAFGPDARHADIAACSVAPLQHCRRCSAAAGAGVRASSDFSARPHTPACTASHHDADLLTLPTWDLAAQHGRTRPRSALASLTAAQCAPHAAAAPLYSGSAEPAQRHGFPRSLETFAPVRVCLTAGAVASAARPSSARRTRARPASARAVLQPGGSAAPPAACVHQRDAAAAHFCSKQAGRWKRHTPWPSARAQAPHLDAGSFALQSARDGVCYDGIERGACAAARVAADAMIWARRSRAAEGQAAQQHTRCMRRHRLGITCGRAPRQVASASAAKWQGYNLLAASTMAAEPAGG